MLTGVLSVRRRRLHGDPDAADHRRAAAAVGAPAGSAADDRRRRAVAAGEGSRASGRRSAHRGACARASGDAMPGIDIGPATAWDVQSTPSGKRVPNAAAAPHASSSRSPARSAHLRRRLAAATAKRSRAPLIGAHRGAVVVVARHRACSRSAVSTAQQEAEPPTAVEPAPVADARASARADADSAPRQPPVTDDGDRHRRGRPRWHRGSRRRQRRSASRPGPCSSIAARAASS